MSAPAKREIIWYLKKGSTTQHLFSHWGGLVRSLCGCHYWDHDLFSETTDPKINYCETCARLLRRMRGKGRKGGGVMPSYKLSREQKLEVYKAHRQGGQKVAALARKNGVSPALLYQVFGQIDRIKKAGPAALDRWVRNEKKKPRPSLSESQARKIAYEVILDLVEADKESGVLAAAIESAVDGDPHDIDLVGEVLFKIQSRWMKKARGVSK